jgi:hypothetical protein
MTAETAAHIDATISPAESAAPPASSAAPEAGRAAITLCPYCGRPDAEPFQVVSRHRTSAGQTVWTRCQCGSLQMRVRDAAGERITARSHPHHHTG